MTVNNIAFIDTQGAKTLNATLTVIIISWIEALSIDKLIPQLPYYCRVTHKLDVYITVEGETIIIPAYALTAETILRALIDNLVIWDKYSSLIAPYIATR